MFAFACDKRIQLWPVQKCGGESLGAGEATSSSSSFFWGTTFKLHRTQRMNKRDARHQRTNCKRSPKGREERPRNNNTMRFSDKSVVFEASTVNALLN